MKYVISISLFAISIATAIFSANLSYVGLEATFPDIPLVGFIGAVIALSTVTISASVAQARRQGQTGVLYGALVLMVMTMALDFGANLSASKGAVDQRTVVYDQALAAFTTAEETLQITRKRIEDAEADLAKVLGDDVSAGQLVLVAAGQDIKVDGKRGPQTNAALAAFGRDLKIDLKDLRTAEAGAAAIVAAGLPEGEDSSELLFAILLAAMLTLLSSSTSFIGGTLLGGQEIDYDQLETAIDAGLENVVAIEKWLDKVA